MKFTLVRFLVRFSLWQFLQTDKSSLKRSSNVMQASLFMHLSTEFNFDPGITQHVSTYL
ncbi:hypothetical protein [Microcoleus sp. N3A4]|uniref:hypothetical protein n=1 Tax=Microcoleus sp. N3A4 TaxID=3055379 RepID=UPI002FD6AF11